MNNKLKSTLYLFLFFLIISFLWVISSYFLEKAQLNKKGLQMTIDKLTPILYTNKVSETINFYKENLSFNVVALMPEKGEPEFAILSNRNIELMIQNDSTISLGENKFISLYMDVDNLQKLFDRIKTKAQIIKPIDKTFYGTKEFTCKDNIGNTLTFAEHIN